MAQVPLRKKNSTNGSDSTHVSVEGAVQETNQAPSDSDSEGSNPVGLVGHSTLVSQVDVRVDDEFDDSKEMLESTIEDGGESEYWETVSDFASDITRAARNALSNRRPYFKKVVAVIVYWETASRLKHLRDQADKLGRLFEDSFSFEVLVYKIPDSLFGWEFTATIGPELKKVSNDQDSLFILYYGGHASIDPQNERFWKKENLPRSPQINWSTAEDALFKGRTFCSILFIFDCCHAGGMIDPNLGWETSCELLGACSADVKASALKASSFTTAFLEEVSNRTYNIWELHAALCSRENRAKYNLVTYPCYQNFMGHQAQSAPTLIKKVGSPAESQDCPRTPPEILHRLTTCSDAVICIAVTFKCTGKAFMEQLDEVKKNWKRWFKFAPTECDDIIVKACRGTELVAVFESNSCITIWSFPIWLWDAMAPLSGYQHIGIIRPQNLALAASNTKSDLAAPNYSSNMIVGELSLSPQSSRPDKLPPIQDTILHGRTGEDDPHLESIKPPSATSTEAKATSKLPTKNLPAQPIQRDMDNPGRWRKRDILGNPHKKKLEPDAPFSSSSPFPNPSRTSTFDVPAMLYLSPIPLNLVDLIHDPSEKRKASRVQGLKTSKEVRNVLSDIQ